MNRSEIVNGVFTSLLSTFLITVAMWFLFSHPISPLTEKSGIISSKFSVEDELYLTIRNSGDLPIENLKVVVNSQKVGYKDYKNISKLPEGGTQTLIFDNLKPKSERRKFLDFTNYTLKNYSKALEFCERLDSGTTTYLGENNTIIDSNKVYRKIHTMKPVVYNLTLIYDSYESLDYIKYPEGKSKSSKIFLKGNKVEFKKINDTCKLDMFSLSTLKGGETHRYFKITVSESIGLKTEASATVK